MRFTLHLCHAMSHQRSVIGDVLIVDQVPEMCRPRRRRRWRSKLIIHFACWSRGSAGREDRSPVAGGMRRVMTQESFWNRNESAAALHSHSHILAAVIGWFARSLYDADNVSRSLGVASVARAPALYMLPKRWRRLTGMLSATVHRCSDFLRRVLSLPDMTSSRWRRVTRSSPWRHDSQVVGWHRRRCPHELRKLLFHAIDSAYRVERRGYWMWVRVCHPGENEVLTIVCEKCIASTNENDCCRIAVSSGTASPIAYGEVVWDTSRRLWYVGLVTSCRVFVT